VDRPNACVPMCKPRFGWDIWSGEGVDQKLTSVANNNGVARQRQEQRRAGLNGALSACMVSSSHKSTILWITIQKVGYPVDGVEEDAQCNRTTEISRDMRGWGRSGTRDSTRCTKTSAGVERKLRKSR